MPNVHDIAARLEDAWRPQIVADANGFQLKVVRIEGEFPWHTHQAEDEVFLCLSGSFRIEQIGWPSPTLQEGDVYVVRRGVRHRPMADEPAFALLFERAETKQYGG
jgi:quercetin dioxygenase-like cupin family protein